MITNLVLAGAQLKGVCYIGVLKGLEELDMIKNIKNILGVSSGSLFGLAMCLGFSSYALENMILKLDIENLKEFQTDSVFKLFYKYGIDSGNKIEKLVKVILKKKTGNENINFKELYELYPNKNFIVGGSNLTNGEMEYFSHDTTPEMPVYLAIRISTSFPFIFEKVEYNDCVYLDGGLIQNYPIEYFEDTENTLGICTSSSNSKNKDLSSFDKYMIQIIYVLSSQGEKYLAHKYIDQTIIVDLNYRYDSIDFSNEMKSYLIKEGYDQFMDKIKEKNINIKIDENEDIASSISVEEEMEEITEVVNDLMEIVSNDTKNILNIEEIVNEY